MIVLNDEKFCRSQNSKKSWISDEKELAFIDVRETAQHITGHPIFSISIPFSEFEINIGSYYLTKMYE